MARQKLASFVTMVAIGDVQVSVGKSAARMLSFPRLPPQLENFAAKVAKRPGQTIDDEGTAISLVVVEDDVPHDNRSSAARRRRFTYQSHAGGLSLLEDAECREVDEPSAVA